MRQGLKQLKKLTKFITETNKNGKNTRRYEYQKRKASRECLQRIV